MDQFKIDVDAGLSLKNKRLASKYFYDSYGDELFMKIMELPEYYLSTCEMEIFTLQSAKLIELMQVQKDQYFEIVELGAGDGTKTAKLLKSLLDNDYQFCYRPLDISLNALNVLEQNLYKQLPKLNIVKMHGDYFEMLDKLKKKEHPVIVLFLGSNIGNMTDDVAAGFLGELSARLKKNDSLILGVDLIKAAEIVLPAYNDSQGVSEAFNKNLLFRINRDLNADFDPGKFEHVVRYTREEGIIKSSLRSMEAQSVQINALEKNYSFLKGEEIHTEVSRKYNDAIIRKIIAETGFVITAKLLDSKKYFANYFFQKKF